MNNASYSSRSLGIDTWRPLPLGTFAVPWKASETMSSVNKEQAEKAFQIGRST